MRQAMLDVQAFNAKFGHPTATVPAVPDEKVKGFCMRLILEEYYELMIALRCDDLPGIAKESADLLWVVIKELLVYGIPIPLVWEAVARSNMSKSTEKDAGGKTIKGPDYIPPDIEGILLRQGWAGVPCPDGTASQDNGAASVLDPAALDGEIS